MFFALFGINSLIIFLTALVGLYFYLTRNFNYWKSRGINGPKPIVLFGTAWQLFFNSMPEIAEQNGRKYGKIHGVFMNTRPVLSISDPQLIKQMNIKDFHIFMDRDNFETGDYFNDRSLFNLKGEEWKKMRSIISPTFSSGKMRSMHPTNVDCVKRLEEYLETKALNKEKNEIELKKVMSNLTMDVIASCAFGTKIDNYNEENRSEFIANAEKAFKGNWRTYVFIIFMTTVPKLLKWTGFQLTDPSIAKFFGSAIRSIISKRKEDKVRHKDYLQLMINAQNNTLDTEEQVINEDNSDEVFDQSNENESLKYNKLKADISEDDILANSFLFFVAGYETTSSLLTHLFYSLALDQKCQQKLYEEVNGFNGDFNYENISKMHYLEACIAETLRLYSPLPVIGRISGEKYTIGETGLTIPKGMLVHFNVQDIHHSEEYYPNPKTWDPMRFMRENRHKLTPYTYMPFGIGPRNCVGMRFALMEAKTAIAHLVNKFQFVRTQNTRVRLKAIKSQFILNMGKIFVGIELRNGSE